jgi:hypothetical protein
MDPIRNQKTPSHPEIRAIGRAADRRGGFGRGRGTRHAWAAWTENSDQVGQPFPPVDRSAPFTLKVPNLLAALTLDEKISVVHKATDPALLGQAGYLPGVPRLGIPPAARRGRARHRHRGEGRALGVDLIYAPQVDLTRHS